MTMTPSRAIATIRTDGNAQVVIDGVAKRVLATTLQQTRADVVAHIAAHARQQGRPIQVDTYDPEGRFVLTVNPDGSLGEMTSNDLPEDTIPPGSVTAEEVVDETASAWGPPGAAPSTLEAPTQVPAPVPAPATGPANVASWMRTAANDPQGARPAETPPQPAPSPFAPGPTPGQEPQQDRPSQQHAPQQQAPQQIPSPQHPTPTHHEAPQLYEAPQQGSSPWTQGQPPPQPQPQQPHSGYPQDHGAGQGQPGSAVGQEQPLTRRQLRESFLKSEQVEAPASKGLRGTLARVGIRTQPSAAERAERDDIHAVSQHWPGVRTIAVVNGKGGANKTPTTALLAATFARYSGAATIAWDNNETRGTLGWRTEQGKHEGTVLDLIPRTDELLNPSARAGDISHFVHHQAADKYDVLRSNPNLLSSEQRISGSDVDSIHDVLGRYYRLILVDSGNDESASHWLRMIEKADQLVVPTIAKPEHAEAGALLLEALTKRGGRSAELAQRAVVVVSQAREKDSNPSAADIARGFEGWVSSVVTIPFDRAMVENVLRFDALGAATQRAWLRAAAAVARQL
ncbi:ATPase [Pseudactinotalea terrae]|uniref:ATPase n=1 Tax=Pseudactinotalea terrae TaxID=1743262 RepID=UPI0012E19924